MKIFAIAKRCVASLVALGVAVPLVAAKGPQIKNYEIEGNLKGEHDLGCIAVTEAKTAYSPVDLYAASAKCVEADRLDDATKLFAMAGVYARFDILRVADRTAHQAATVLVYNFFDSIGEDGQARMSASIAKVVDEPASIAALCSTLRAIGAPSYKPSYMVNHGMGAMLGGSGDDSVENFDSASAYEKTLMSYIHCAAA